MLEINIQARNKGNKWERLILLLKKQNHQQKREEKMFYPETQAIFHLTYKKTT